MAPTLIKPPPPPPHLSLMEATLQLKPLPAFGPSIFTNTRALWHPPGARGIYGGAAIAQSLLAAYKTLPSPEYLIHSMHCYFVLAGDSDLPVIYYVERVRDGRGYVTRTVQARQAGKVIFTTTMSFSRRSGKKQLKHAVALPGGISETCPSKLFEPIISEEEKRQSEANGGPAGERSPFEAWRLPILTKSPATGEKVKLSERRARNWIRARGPISDNSSPDYTISPDTAENGFHLSSHVPHVCALAYMSDSYFVGTVPRVHNLTRVPNRASLEQAIQSMTESNRPLQAQLLSSYLTELTESEAEAASRSPSSPDPLPQLGMMVSLDHTIFFHNPEHFRADEWLFSEMWTPWADDGRGLVIQHFWNQDGILIATCTQEGVVRLKQDGGSGSSSSSSKKRDSGDGGKKAKL